MRTTHRYGWTRDIPDQRDFKLTPPEKTAPLPSKVDLYGFFPPALDQGQLGSCTANAIAGAIEFDQNKQRSPIKPPSRLFIYYNERDIEGNAASDSGAQIRDGIKTVASLGVCPETNWPYTEDLYAVKPPPSCYATASKGLVTSYLSVAQDLDSMRACLAAGYPFVIGFTVFESFESDTVAQSGIVPMPGPDEAVIGGHAVLCIGYDDSTGRFLARNSWGPDWGLEGNFQIPYGYLTNPGLAADFWTIRSIEIAS